MGLWWQGRGWVSVRLILCWLPRPRADGKFWKTSFLVPILPPLVVIGMLVWWCLTPGLAPPGVNLEMVGLGKGPGTAKVKESPRQPAGRGAPRKGRDAPGRLRGAQARRKHRARVISSLRKSEGGKTRRTERLHRRWKTILSVLTWVGKVFFPSAPGIHKSNKTFGPFLSRLEMVIATQGMPGAIPWIKEQRRVFLK